MIVFVVARARLRHRFRLCHVSKPLVCTAHFYASTRHFEPCPYTSGQRAEVEDTLSSPWWSVPQAIVWIVTRSESQLLRADGVRTLAGVKQMKGIRPASKANAPPPSFTSAPNELLHAWRAQLITLVGHKWGKEPSRSIATRSDLRLRDDRGEVCLGNKTLYFNTNPFWSNLSVRADDCKRCWPAPAAEKKPGFRLRTVANCPSDSEVLAFMEETRQALRAEQKRAGRDVLLRAAMNHFGLSRKIALSIWNNTARDRKGGRPKSANLERSHRS
ncbi:MAG: hypothetical protein HYX38_10100 [Rhodospirillales bacterium]|nr:hypothetical protein [Rhodospirillales bacterium]